MKQSNNLSTSKKTPTSKKFLKCFNDIPPIFSFHHAQGGISQRSTQQTSARKTAKATSSKDNSAHKRLSIGMMIKGKGISPFSPASEGRRTKDVFTQFIFKRKENTNTYQKYYIKPIQKATSKPMTQLQYQLELNNEEASDKSKKRTGSNHKKRLLTRSSKAIVTERCDFNDDYYLKKVERDSSLIDINSSGKKNYGADNSYQRCSQTQRENTEDKSRKLFKNKSYLVFNKISEVSFASSLTPTKQSYAKSPNTHRNNSSSKSLSTNISNAHLTSDRHDQVTSYEEVHFLFVEAFQKKKKFLVTNSISKHNSIEII